MGQDARDPALWGNRYGDPQSAKGYGFLGPLQRPDGGMSSEISIGVDLDGQQVEIPALVPTLSPDEVQQLLRMNLDQERVPPSIIQKAVAYARQRKQQGQPYFAAQNEQNRTAMPQFPRVATVPPGASFLNPSHGTGALPMDSPDFQQALQYLAQRIGR